MDVLRPSGSTILSKWEYWAVMKDQKVERERGSRNWCYKRILSLLYNQTNDNTPKDRTTTYLPYASCLNSALNVQCSLVSIYKNGIDVCVDLYWWWKEQQYKLIKFLLRQVLTYILAILCYSWMSHCKKKCLCLGQKTRHTWLLVLPILPRIAN